MIDAIIRNANRSEAAALADLINRENKGSAVGGEYIEHWYWENPSASCVVSVCDVGGRIEGMVSTNNFAFDIDGRHKLVAMPQKVLTSARIRGKGYFRQMYFACEEENLESQGVDLFVTLTNKMSTAIFLSRLGYERGLSPRILFLPFRLSGRHKKHRSEKHRTVKRFNENYLASTAPVQSTNGPKKDRGYFKWRYESESYESEKISPYLLLECSENGEIIGYGVLKKIVKKGVPVFLLADILAADQQQATRVFQACHASIPTRAVGMLVIQNDLVAHALSKSRLKVAFDNRLNLLVKGQTTEETRALSRMEFNFFFGDFDFV